MTPSGKIAKADLAKMAEDMKRAGSPAQSVYSRTPINASPNPPAK